MPPALLDLLTMLGVVVILWAPAEVVLAVLLTAVFVVPAPLRVPHTPTIYATVLNVLVVAAGARVVFGLLETSVRRSALRWTPVHRAWLAYAGTAIVIGVVIPSATAVPEAGERIAGLAVQIAFFVVVLALLREMGDLRRVLLVATGAALVGAAIGIVEHVTGGSLGHWLFARAGGAGAFSAAHPLDVRQGQVRVRAGAEFALQYGWLLTMVLPLVVVAVLKLRRGTALAAVAVAVVGAAVYWSFARTALAAVPVAVVLLAVLARQRRALMLAGACAVAGLVAVALRPGLLTHVSAAADRGTIEARALRYAPILDRVAHTPTRGLGLGNLSASGFPTTDNAYLLSYTELGVIGVVALVALLLVAVVQSAAAVTAADQDARLVGAACTAGVVAYLASAATYDAFTLLQGTLLLWFLVALSTVAAERAGVVLALPRPALPVVAGLAAAGAAVGFVVYALAPRHVAVDAAFVALPASQLVPPTDPVGLGDFAAAGTCAAADAPAVRATGGTVECRADPRSTGLGRIRISASSSDQVVATAKAFEIVVTKDRHLFGYRLYPFAPPRSGRPAPLTTAPVWLPLTAVAVALLVPRRRVRFGPADSA